ncbi:MAG: DeoR/GlpR family DNA-binding transcription regulator [Anaerolineae bacterium]|jgi:DeoR/GlpR family transcriptional regulator of sugar metabolism|nr:DeoR/GlpR family DNA-binding transcription regulator [Anaerolineae bacterium]MDH7474789.1 DeoR/GlpR family DNA-binding transcription regulator [Anaerolineae bacterium]
MTDKLFPEERLERIASLVMERQRVSVAELSVLLDVSQVTIRNDLDELERRGLLKRTHGGALAIEQDYNNKKAELSFDVRERLQRGEKERIGQMAASLVHDGDAIAFDASTTALQVARRIKDRRELTVVTNGIRIALEFMDSPHITVVMPGGILRRDAVSLVGELGEEVLAKFNVQKGFFGARGVTLEEGLTDVDSYEVHLKRAMVRAAKEVIAIVDHTKWGHVGFVSFASIDQVDRIITDDGAPSDMVAALRDAGVDVIIA